MRFHYDRVIVLYDSGVLTVEFVFFFLKNILYLLEIFANSKFNLFLHLHLHNQCL